MDDKSEDRKLPIPDTPIRLTDWYRPFYTIT
jgi:hypothetical protein